MPFEILEKDVQNFGIYYVFNRHSYKNLWLNEINHNPANTYLFKVNNRNTRKRGDLCSNLL